MRHAMTFNTQSHVLCIAAMGVFASEQVLSKIVQKGLCW
jgi:hypothetical protein